MPDIKVRIKPNLFLHSCNVPFEMHDSMSRIKIGNFTSAESWAILRRKMVKGLQCRSSLLSLKFLGCDIILGTQVLFTLTDFMS